VVLTHQLTSKLPAASGGRGLEAAQKVPAAAREAVAPKIADAFGTTFWVAAGVIALAVIPALLLPRHKPSQPPSPEETIARAEDEAMLVEV
jgi:hypothetical protein